MEKVQNLKHCHWVSDEIIFKDFYTDHNEALKTTFDAHPSKVGWKESCKSYFQQHVPYGSDEELSEMDRLTAIADISDPQKIEEDCSVDLLTVPNELPASEKLDENTSIEPNLVTNWFEGSFSDSAIPEGGSRRLLTLYNQEVELSRRNSIGDYGTLRYRSLKYFSTVRLPQQVNQMPFVGDFSDDMVVNVRIQRPFFKKTHYKKHCNKFPTHSQELSFLGSFALTALRDAIVCVNDVSCHENLALKPNLEDVRSYPTSQDLFPSGLFYINGTFYNDLRHPNAKDYSDHLLNWAKKQPDFGEFRVAEMSSVKISDLCLRLGYPYLYLHLGDCEHLITFTDVRLAEATDPSDPSLYPIARGHSSKLSVKCITCNTNLAVWVVVGFIKMAVPRAHLCDQCLKQFCYDANQTPLGTFKLYRFYDESSVLLEKSKRSKRLEKVHPKRIKRELEDTDSRLGVSTDHKVFKYTADDV